MIEFLKERTIGYFFVKLLLLFLIVLALDIVAGSTLRHFYFKQTSGLQYRTTYAIDKTNEEVLIFGSSRANHHYKPAVFESGLGMTCYNTGRDGQCIFYHYALLKSILKRYTPKIVLLDFTLSDLHEDARSYDRLSILLPYCRDHAEIKDIINLKGPFEKWKLYSAVYPYNSSIFTIAVGNAGFNKKRREDVKGYVPLNNEWRAPIQTLLKPEEDFRVDSVKLNMFESFIQECSSRKIKLYIVSSPIFRKQQYVDPYNELARKTAEKYKVNFFDHLQDPAFLNSNEKLFSDISHLNDRGADRFSKMLIETIAKDITPPPYQMP